MKRSRLAFLICATISLVSASAIAGAEEPGSLPKINGEIKKVDESADKITIKHEAITNLDMSAMTMVFKANDPALLKDMKPGDKIKFSAEKVNGQITVMTIDQAK
jgi:Cu/Ag efflux protein CusF